ncbi:MAG: NAD(P)-dependent oxidoreductase [Elusimicrobia bacterium]|nr:NAD(P)-dependent oxidoreductase [Elusimicrobiota bacterium]
MRKRGQERVLLTGATGFIGRRLAETLLEAECNVHLLVRPSSDKKPLYALAGEPVLHEHDGTMQGMMKLFRAAEPDTVIHLAGVTLPDHSVEDVDAMLQANVVLGTQILDACLRFKTKRFINTGTYWQHFNHDAYNPVCLYAATKQALEDILRYYTETSTLRALTLVLYDVYGPGDPRDKLLSQLERARRDGGELKLTPGRQLVDFVHVDDVASAYVHALKLLSERASDVHGRSFSVRTGKPVSVKEFIETYLRLTQANVPVEFGAKPYRPRVVMSPWEGPLLPGWKARIGLEDGLRRTIDCWSPKSKAKAAHG